ncbi:Hsp20/alpha crystallin family protein [Haloferax namakaokahaiae]|uniref:Hsp20/alpha crystallin family protein n=1 Tax=Haloferax namakaokahaiae TaxID=1748331 RepID=A0ABD5ZID5_9EURY
MDDSSTGDDDDPFERIHQSLGDVRLGHATDIPVDIVDRGDHLELVANLPGYTRDEIEIDVNERGVNISAVSEGHPHSESLNFVLRERRREPLSRGVRLPTAVVSDEATYLLRRGVLVLTLPKVDPEWSLDEYTRN